MSNSCKKTSDSIKKISDNTNISLFAECSYYEEQIKRSILKSETHDNSRVKNFITLAEEIVDFNDKNILCIGVRTPDEIFLFRQKTKGLVIGIDLFSKTEDVKVMDMHNLTFSSDSFDIIFGSHILEHAKDIDKVVLELLKVSKDCACWIFEVPSNYTTNNVDRYDWEDLKTFKSLFSRIPHSTLYEHYYTVGEMNPIN